jgi:DNA polymerase-3 subunit alpha
MDYQEHIINLHQLVDGYTPGEAYLVLKAIGKKKRDIMMAEEPKFIAGCVRQGLSETQAKQLWKQIQPFADYSFNKAHATCYTQIAYWTAYLKAHYPAAFMAALMTSDFDDTDRLAIEITECKHMGIDVLSPDVNESFVEFAVVPGERPQVRFGMAAIKNVGTGAVEEILRARSAGPFESLEDFLGKVNCRIVNRKAMESLIKAGAFDRFSDRSTLLHNLDMMLAYASRLQKQADSGQVDLFGLSGDAVIERAKLTLEPAGTVYDTHEQLTWERELLGLFLSRHPLEVYEKFLEEQTVPLASLTPDHDGRSVQIGGAVVDAREITTKNGQKMAFVKLEDLSGELEVILFPNAYQQTLGIWSRDKVVLVRGKVSAKDRDGNTGNEVKVLVDDAREVTAAQAEAYQPSGKKAKVPKTKSTATSLLKGPGAKAAVVSNPKLYIRLQSSEDPKILMTLKETLDAFTGPTEVVLVLGSSESRQAIKLPTGVDRESDAVSKLEKLVGASNVKIQ